MAPYSYDRAIRAIRPPRRCHFWRAGFKNTFITILLSFIIALPSFAQAQSESCDSGHFTEFKDLMTLANHFKKSEQTDDMVSIFERSLSCADRIWKTKNTRLGTLPTYFYNTKTSSVCLWEKDKGCRPNRKILHDREFQRAVSDLIGYSTFHFKEQNREVLVLNRSVSDFAQKAKAANQEWIHSLNQKAARCSPLTSAQTVPLQAIDIDSVLKDHFMEGFSIHETFHLHQRKWPKRIVHSEKLKSEKETKLSLANLLTERLSFHLLQYIQNTQSGHTEKALEHLKFAKGAYVLFKKEAPVILSDRDNKNEGTAVFVDAKTQALMKLGCDASKEEVMSKTIQNVRKLVAIEILDPNSPYILSSLASLALALNEKPGWQEEVERNEKTPLDILLDDPELAARDVDLNAAKPLVECLSN